jgi:hypothetical protein
MASGPGLIVPLTTLPSQAITIVMWVLDDADGPQSPDQVPVSGWPSWAGAGHAPTEISKATTSNGRLFMDAKRF